MKRTLAHQIRIATSLCALVVFATCVISITAHAQENRNEQQTVPPPMKLISKDALAQLSTARTPKERTRAAIELAESRISRAEELTTRQQYDEAAGELGIYQGIVEDSLRYLGEVKPNNSKLRDIYKRLELALRAISARIESIRRVTPVDYAVNIKPIIEYTRHARTQALDSFYGDTVLRENSNAEAKPSTTETPKDSTP